MGRLVSTHSTYIDGLLIVLKRLVRDENIKTITPGVITRTRSNSSKLLLKITRDIAGGHKLVARKGKSAQELYVLSKYCRSELEKEIGKIIL